MEDLLKQILKKLETLDTLENRFDVMERRFDSLENRFDTMENRFDTMENRFDTMENRFDTMENRFDTMEKDLKEVKSSQINLTDKMHLFESKINARFNVVEKKIDTVYDAVADLMEFKTEAEQKLKIIK